MTPETIQRLEEAFKIGATDKEAYVYANISHETYYKHLKENEEFAERMETAKQFPILAMKKVVIQAAVSGDKQSAQWYLERKKKDEFAQRTELTGSEGTPLGYVYQSDIKQLEPIEPKQLEKGTDNATI